jgi:hypothetical protein
VTLSAFSREWGEQIAHWLAGLLGETDAIAARQAVTFAVQVKVETADGSVVHPGNPLNLRPRAAVWGPWPGQTGVTPDDFAIFDSFQAGAKAAAANYATPLYAAVQDAFRSGDPIALAKAVEDSPWDSGHYAHRLDVLVAAEIGGYEVTITRDIYAQQIEPLVKETIKVMVEHDGETRDAIAALAPATSTEAVIATIRDRLGKGATP